MAYTSSAVDPYAPEVHTLINCNPIQRCSNQIHSNNSKLSSFDEEIFTSAGDFDHLILCDKAYCRERQFTLAPVSNNAL